VLGEQMIVAESDGVHPLGRPDQEYVAYDPDPPVGDAVKVTDWPTSAGFWVTVGAGTTRGGLTVTSIALDAEL